MTKDDIDNLADELGTPMLRMDGYDDCVIGYVRAFGRSAVLLYDHDLVIAKLAADMTVEEAEEFFEFNQAGAYVGPGTPAFAFLEGAD